MALAGLGLAYLYEDVMKDHLAEGRQVHVLANRSAQISGCYLHYPSRRQHIRAFSLLVNALHYPGRAYGGNRSFC